TTKRKINFFAEAAALANSQKSIRGNCPSRGCDVGGANVFQMGQKSPNWCNRCVKKAHKKRIFDGVNRAL
ncbi:hypothetical protein CXR89_15285, partial [Listeria monocytogenes]|uniref:hypothetical protein n=1 Tax=Listeria monocytogenes TaxID=1639 RepID=UPI000D4C126E